MKVLAVAPRFGPGGCGGAETHIAELLAALVDAGHVAAAVLSDQDGPRYRWRGVQVMPGPRPPAADLVAWADVIVTHLAATPAAAALGQLNTTPVAVIAHNTFAAGKDALTASRARVDLVAANSRWVAADLAADLTSWCRDQRVDPRVVVCRPIPTSIDPAPGPRDRVTLVNCRRRDPTDTSGGQLTKGGELFRRLAEALPHVAFLAVRGGYGTQQDLDDLGNVDVVGPVDHDRMATEVWARTRLLVAPSNYESWGRAAVEAMAHGIPVVAADTPGLRESVGDGGTLLPAGDTERWCQIVQTVHCDPQRWNSEQLRAVDRWIKLQQVGRTDLKRWVAELEQLAARKETLCASS